MLNSFLSMLKLLNTRIDLGYNNLETNGMLIRTIPNIILAIIDYKSSINSQK
jgi:hypothetical protein